MVVDNQMGFRPYPGWRNAMDKKVTIRYTKPNGDCAVVVYRYLYHGNNIEMLEDITRFAKDLESGGNAGIDIVVE